MPKGPIRLGSPGALRQTGVKTLLDIELLGCREKTTDTLISGQDCLLRHARDALPPEAEPQPRLQ